MHKRFMFTSVVLGGVVLAVSALPAFTADSGTISATVAVEAPPAPCVEFSAAGTAVDFGTRRFSGPGSDSFAPGDLAPRFSNCSTAVQSFLVAGVDAVGPAAAVWTLTGSVGVNMCPTLNSYRLLYSTDGSGSWPITKSPTPLRNLLTGATTFVPGEAHDLGLEMLMPCQGSAGAGQVFSFNTTLTAVLA